MNNQQDTSDLRIAVKQFFSYALIGMLSNIAGYSVYLMLTYLGTTPKLTMTVLYIVGACVGFFGNRKFTFRHRGHLAAAGIRYLLAHMLGYFLNLSLLIVFADRFGYAHQFVQACAIAIVAVFLFITFRFFVFPGGESQDRGVAKR